MTTSEFSDAFDVALASLFTEGPFGDTNNRVTVSLDEYEKSVFLTRAEVDIVLGYFEDNGNKQLAGFDHSPRRQGDFSTLVTSCDLDAYDGTVAFDKRGIRFVAPSDELLALNGQVTDSEGRIYTVVPISYTEYSRLMSQPYTYPAKRQAWRLIVGKTSDDIPVYEAIGRFHGDITYTERYVRMPRPIVLVDLSTVQEGLSVRGYTGVTECELPEVTHTDILQRAVELAKAAHEVADGNRAALASMVSLGLTSQTAVGAGQMSQ